MVFWQSEEVAYFRTIDYFNMSNIQIIPVLDKLLVKEMSTESQRTVGGIIVPDNAKGLSRGFVVAVGQGTKDMPMVVSVGDEVMYKPGSGEEVVIDGERYRIIKQSDVYAIIRKQ